MKPMYPQRQNQQQPGTAVTVEQYNYINSRSYDELCDIHVEQEMTGMGAPQPKWWTNLLAYRDNRQKLKKCSIGKLKKTFSHNELKEIFIQPVGMDKLKYDRKLAVYHDEAARCINALPRP